MNLNNEQIIRYSRHILLKGVGGKGQEKLLDSKVLIVGAGGLVRRFPCISRRQALER